MRVRSAKCGLVGLVVAVLAMAAAASASAKEDHYLAEVFGAGELSLEERSGVVYDKATDEVYVADTGHGRIARYAATGGAPQGNLATLAEPTFLAVDNSSGDVYIVEGREAIVKLDPSGSPITSWGTGGRMEGFGEIGGIAVDPSGNLFILGADFMVRELSPAGDVANACSEPYRIGSYQSNPVDIQVNPVGIAADGEGHLYISLTEPGFGGRPHPFVSKITTACGQITEHFGSGYQPLTSPGVDEADDSVYTTREETGGRVGHYSASGEPIGGGGPSGPGAFGYGQGVSVTGQLTVRSSDETVYVNDLGHDDIAVYPVGNIEPPQIEILTPTEVTTSSARLRATINPGAPAGDPPAWDVRYRIFCVNLSLDEEFPQPRCNNGELEGTVPAGSEPVLVEGTATNLEAASEYAVYVTWQNGAYLNEQVPQRSQDGPRFQTGAIAPSIGEAFVTEASESTATVSASINPHGAETGYLVEYVTRAQFEASGFTGAARTPELLIPAGVKGVPVSVTVPGLSASTPYVLRVFATNTIEESVEEVFGEPIGFTTREPALPPVSGCSNEAFRGGFGALLPDCRAYEQATPTDKNGGGPESVPGVLQATEEPAGITFFSQGGIPGGVGAQDYPSFLSTRGEGAWSTQGLLPPATLGRRGEYLGLTPGGRYSITEANHYDPDTGEYATGLFERDLRTGQMTTIAPYNGNGDCAEVTCYHLAGASADGARVFIESEAPLTLGQAGEETPPGQPNVFVWERGSGRISLVDVDEDGAPLPEGAFAGPFGGIEGNFGHGGTAGNYYVQALNAITRDGGQVVYTERGPSEEEEEEGEEGEGHRQLFVRTGIGTGSPRSVKISAYQEGREGHEYPAEFLEATPDGRYVFFRSRAELTSDSYSGEGTDSLYRYDVAGEELVDVTTEKKQKFAAGPGIVGMIGASESGQLAYLVSTTVLTSEAGPGGALAEAGKPNLYLWREGAKKPYSFIATLQGTRPEEAFSDAADWSRLVENNGAYYNKSARVSPDGGAVVFSSRRALTGQENRSKSCGLGRGLGPCPEFFRYSAATGVLDCISCNPTGVQPLGGASIGTLFIEAMDLPGAYGAPFLPKNLSADGNRFFFQTPDSLVAADVNGRSGCQVQQTEIKSSCMDVYEWEAPGAGSCPQAAAATADGGCLYLISTGQSDNGSYFADADRDGRNVYLVTYSQLVPADRDNISDIYDATEGGGLASQHQEPAVPCASRQACQGPQASPEAATSPGSSSLVSPGNPKAATGCRKGFVKRHGKCVKRRRHHKRHHRKHHRKHHKGTVHKGGRK